MKAFRGVAISLALTLLWCLSFPCVFASSTLTVGSSYIFGGYENATFELGNQSLLTAQLASYSSSAGYVTHDWNITACTQGNIATAANATGQPNSISFYYGEGGINNVGGTNQYYIQMGDGVTVAYDYWIWTQVETYDTSFVFLWACEQGNVIGGVGNNNIYGMPFAWLSTLALSPEGYQNPDHSLRCFIGWNNTAPALSNNNFYPAAINFLEDFYLNALVYGQTNTVNMALDDAANYVWGTNFASCPFLTGINLSGSTKSNMVVYGDGSMHLHILEPAFAMKTLASGSQAGWFYKPNITVPFMQIEEWFTNSCAQGDQVGETVAGYPFPFPDGKVGLTDLVALDNAYGSSEGGSNWNYQVDIVPDRQINLADLAMLTKNYGNTSSSWYSTNLSQITVSFSFADGSWMNGCEPDSSGFVRIPWNCTGWFVLNQQTPVGAFITFWK